MLAQILQCLYIHSNIYLPNCKLHEDKETAYEEDKTLVCQS